MEFNQDRKTKKLTKRKTDEFTAKTSIWLETTKSQKASNKAGEKYLQSILSKIREKELQNKKRKSSKKKGKGYKQVTHRRENNDQKMFNHATTVKKMKVK